MAPPLMESMLAFIHRLTERPLLTCVAVAVLTVVLRLAIIPVLPIPEPWTNDELSYILASDTFASGRLANPPHPKWIFFETHHVNQQPMYVSKYPPAQGLTLAFGQRWLGNPWYGVLLTMGLFCGAVCWMLQGYFSPAWALFGALAVMTQWGLTTYWMNSYWGGGVAAFAGALLLGAVPRLLRKPSPWLMLIAAAAVGILANSRPYEGLLTVIAAFGVVVFTLRREKQSFWYVFKPVNLIGAAVLLLAVFAWMGYYNYRTTGSATTMPYVINERTYAYAPRFWALPAKPVREYNHASIAGLWSWDYDLWHKEHVNPLRVAYWWYTDILPFLAPPLWLFAALAGAILSRGWNVRAALAMLGFVAAGVALETGQMPHYLAPVWGSWVILAVLGIRQFTTHNRLTAVVAAASFLIASGVGVAYSMKRSTGLPLLKPIVKELNQRTEPQLVFVHYSPNHDPHLQYVFNRADIDGSHIVWAHDMGKRNQELLDYYPNRKAWILNADEQPMRLVPLQPPSQP